MGGGGGRLPGTGVYKVVSGIAIHQDPPRVDPDPA